MRKENCKDSERMFVKRRSAALMLSIAILPQWVHAALLRT